MPKPPPTFTAIIPTRYAPPTLAATIHTLLRQDLLIDILLVDTGTADHDYQQWRTACQRIQRVAVTKIKPSRPDYPSHVIAAAIDLGCDLATTSHVLLTHDDVWLRHRGVLRDLFRRMIRAATPIIGYQMSPRSHLTDEWEGMISHTLTLIDLDWLRSEKLRWDMSAALPPAWSGAVRPGWPDTETAFGRAMKTRGIYPTFIGYETNNPHHQDPWITHRRSLTSHRLYQRNITMPDQDWIEAEVEIALTL